ncbi:pilin [Burkholderia sp. LMG 13014]|uniref:pilin n=1 Tax=Burkholderia sp. LMG 13014 TaxID=2709306 RepID=UPI0023DD45E1|nr:pilin [Burkholderia sp. LMG 13014]
MKITRIKKNAQKGFTLIELMITVAIVGILAAIAFPAYQDYVIRAQVSEALEVVGGLQSDIQEYYAENGVLPANNTVLSTTMPVGKYSYVNNVQNGLIVARFTPAANSKLAPSILGIEAIPDATGTIYFKCNKFANMKTSWLPSSCKDAIDLNGFGG